MLYKTIILFILAILVAAPLAFFAQDNYTLGFDPDSILKESSQLGNADPATIAYGIINWALLFLGLITLAMVIASGFMWMFAAGEEEKIKKAQDILKGALAGLIIVLASYGLAQYVFDSLINIVSTAPAETIILDEGAELNL